MIDLHRYQGLLFVVLAVASAVAVCNAALLAGFGEDPAVFNDPDRQLAWAQLERVCAQVAGVEAEARALHERALRLRVPARTVQRLELERDAVLMTQLGLPLDEVGVAYVCIGNSRSDPVSGPEDLARAVDAAVSEPAF